MSVMPMPETLCSENFRSSPGGATAAFAERPHGEKHRQKQGDHGVADEEADLAPEGFLGVQELDHGAREEEHHRQQHGEDREAEGRQGLPRGDRRRELRRGDFDPLHGELGEERSGDGGDGNPQYQRPQDDLTHVRVQRLDGDDGTGMRGHQAMHDGQEREQRQHEAQERLAGLLGEGDDDRQDEQQADREPRRHADAEREQDDAEADARRPERADELLGEDPCPARFGEELTEDDPEHDDRAGAGQGVAEARLEGLEDLRHGERAGGGHDHRAERQRADQQGDERIQLQPGHQQDQDGDGEQGVKHGVRGIRVSAGRPWHE
jgi:hypothetical protein